MRLVDYLGHVLRHHGETLKQLSVLVGNEDLFEALEKQGESATPLPAYLGLDPASLFTNEPGAEANYAELSSQVMDQDLPPMLEFHAWAYPTYRAFVEQGAELSAKIKDEALAGLIDRTLEASKRWVQSLPIHPRLSPRVELASSNTWMKFRTEVLKRDGKNFLKRIV